MAVPVVAVPVVVAPVVVGAEHRRQMPDFATARQPVRSAERWPQLDPAGEVDLEDPAQIETAVQGILDRRYAGGYDTALLHLAMTDVARAYCGEYPGLLRCDALYHDLRHSLDTALTMARMLDGCAHVHPPGAAAGIDAAHALLGILLALFHDIGLLRRDSEEHLWGPVLYPVHEERGVAFVQAYLSNTSLSPFAGEARLIMATKLVFKIPDSWTAQERLLASLVATADLVSQTSDRCYLEKCRDFVYSEFSAFGLAGKPDSLYPSSRMLLEKTPAFVEDFLQKRLDEELLGVRQYLRIHMRGADPWGKAMRRNVAYLKELIETDDLARLRRRPAPYTGGARQPVSRQPSAAPEPPAQNSAPQVTAFALDRAVSEPNATEVGPSGFHRSTAVARPRG